MLEGTDRKHDIVRLFSQFAWWDATEVVFDQSKLASTKWVLRILSLFTYIFCLYSAGSNAGNFDIGVG